jgi:hypothetical protein
VSGTLEGSGVPLESLNGRCRPCRGIWPRGILRCRISSPSHPPDLADAAFLHAAEGGDLGRDDALVDADDAVFERLGDAPDAADVVISRRRHPNLRHMAAERCGGCV